MGRITKYDPEYCEQLIEHMSKGLSFEAFAGHVGVSKQTIYDWVDRHEEFKEAKDIATEKCRLWWESVGIKHIVTRSKSEQGIGSKSTSLNSQVWTINMKNRFGWRDRQPDEVDTTVVNNITNVQPVDLDERIQQIKDKK